MSWNCDCVDKAGFPRRFQECNAIKFAGSIWISTYGLGKGTALADGNPVTLSDTESGGNVGGEVLVALLVTVESSQSNGRLIGLGVD